MQAIQPWTCVVVGGGYAGIHAVKAILKTFKAGGNPMPLNVILIDKNPYHLRKVLLFKPTVNKDEIRIPLSGMFPADVECVQAAVTRIDANEHKLIVQSGGEDQAISYDVLVMAAGSVVRQTSPELGGIALTSLTAAERIRSAWRGNLQQAVRETDAAERQRLMTIAVAGAGISGIETSAELAYYVRADARELGLDPDQAKIVLINSAGRLFPEGPAKVGNKLERSLRESGVAVMHGNRVVRENEGKLWLDNGSMMSVGLCIWTLGLLPNPLLGQMGLPVTPDGYVIVDESYRVQGLPDVYSIGDCARIVDKATGREDGKTCKEATGQAPRLAKVILADRTGQPAPRHKGYMDFYCFGLGPERGMAWTRQWGLDMVFTGKLAWRLRKFTWDSASLLK